MIRPSQVPDRWIHATLAVLIVAGLGLRGTSLGITLFNLDEAMMSIYGAQIGDLQRFTAVGIKTSFGFSNPPLLPYLLAPFFALTHDPRFAILGLAAAGAAAIGLVGYTAWRLWGKWAAVASAAVTAFSPNAIEHSRRLWGHDTMIFWSALCTYCAVRSVQSKDRRWLWGSMATAAAAQACHLSGILLWVIPLGVLFLFRPRHSIQSLGAGVLILAFVYAPWFLHDAVTENFEETRALFGTVLEGGDGSGGLQVGDNLIWWVTLLVDSQHNDLFGMSFGEFLFSSRWFSVFLSIGYGLFGGLLLSGAVALLFGILSRFDPDPARRNWALILLVALVSPLVVFALLPVPTVAPYQLPAFVPAALGVGLFVNKTGAFIGREARQHESSVYDATAACLILISLILVCALFGFTYTAKSRSYLANVGINHRGSPILRNKIDAMVYIHGAAGGQPYTIMQNDLRSGDIAYWVAYLNFWISGDAKTPQNPDAPQIFYVLDNITETGQEMRDWLSGRQPRVFGNLMVFRFSGQRAEIFKQIFLHTDQSSPGEEGEPFSRADSSSRRTALGAS